MSYTIEEVKAWVELEMEEIMRGLENCKDVPAWARNSDHFLHCWKSGCWLNFVNRENGATEEEIHAIGFAHGSKCAFAFPPDIKPYEFAVAYANKFRDSHYVPGTVMSNFRVEGPDGTKLVTHVDAIPKL